MKEPKIDLQKIAEQIHELAQYHDYVCNRANAKKLKKAIKLLEDVYGMYFKF